MTEDLQYWHVTDGDLTVSNERFKYGNSSLKWQWSSSSSCLTFTNPEVFRSIKWNNNQCFAFWLYNAEPMKSDSDHRPQPMYVEFLTADAHQPVARLWYHVNFVGWRPLGFRYALLPQMKGNLSRIHGIRFYAPSNIDQGIVYLNGVDFDYAHNVGPKSDYQQPWATPEHIKRLDDDPMTWLFDPNNIFYQRPWLEQEPIKATEEDVAKLKDRWLSSFPYATWSPSTKPEPFDRLLELAKPYGISMNSCSNVPLGKGGFYSPSNSMDIQPFLLGPLKRTATTYQCYRYKRNTDSEEAQRIWTLLLQCCDYLIEQGWTEGNSNLEGHLDIGYEIRNFPMCLVYVRDSLQQANRLQPLLLAAMWIMHGELMIEKNTSTMSTDIIHNYLILLGRLIVCLPDQEEVIRRMIAFRYMLNYSFENRIHEPLALDGTVHHHWMCHFEYAAYSLPDIITLTADLNDTPFHLPDHMHHILRRCVLVVNFCLIENDKIPPNLNARAGRCIACNGLNMAKKCVCIGDEDHPYDPFVAGILLTICPKNDKCLTTYLKDGVEPVPLTGHMTLNSTAACVHRRSNFYASIVGMGKNRRGLEIYGWLPDSNNYGEYVRNCSIFLIRADEQGTIKYSNAGCEYPGWNWSHWPGTTCLLKPREELFEGYCNLTAKNWLAGGTSIADEDGMFSNDFFVWDVAFRRSVYCFANRLTVLTSNIKLLQQKKRPVITTLFQSNFTNLEQKEQTPMIINNEENISEFPFERSYDDLTNLFSIMDHRKVVYYLHPEENANESVKIHLKRSEQEMIYCNQYYLIDPKQNPIIDMKSKKFKEAKFVDNEKYFQTTKDNYGLGYIEHLKVDDSSATFVYTILIEPSSFNEWTDEFTRTSRDPWSSERDDLPPSIIFSKGDDKHIFYDRDTDTTCYTCYSNDRLQIDLGLLRSLGQPCTAMIRGRAPGTIRASIATTDFMLNKTMTMVFKGKWVDPELVSDDQNGCVHIRSELLDDGDTQVTVWQRLYMPVEFLLTPHSE